MTSGRENIGHLINWRAQLLWNSFRNWSLKRNWLHAVHEIGRNWIPKSFWRMRNVSPLHPRSIRSDQQAEPMHSFREGITSSRITRARTSLGKAKYIRPIKPPVLLPSSSVREKSAFPVPQGSCSTVPCCSMEHLGTETEEHEGRTVWKKIVSCHGGRKK